MGLLVAFYYMFPLYFAIRHSEYNYDNTFLFRKGLKIMTIALIFQEIFGHYLGGDPPSRMEAIPNAILYAMYYSVSHLLN